MQPEQSGGQGSIPGRAPPHERHEKGSRTQFSASVSASVIPQLGAKRCKFTFTFMLVQQFISAFLIIIITSSSVFYGGTN